jgi:predicted nucleotidyltransferase
MGQMSRDEIVMFLREHRTEIERRFGVTRLGLVGSYARGEATGASDIDLVVEIESGNRFRSFFGLLHFLQDSLPAKIDLVTESSLKPLVRGSVMKDILYV